MVMRRSGPRGVIAPLWWLMGKRVLVLYLSDVFVALYTLVELGLQLSFPSPCLPFSFFLFSLFVQCHSGR